MMSQSDAIDKPRLHIGIIPDGNRRYARSKGKDFYAGYLDGISRLDELISTIGDETNDLQAIGMVTVFVCSIDNLTKRTSDEVSKLFSLFRVYFARYNTENSILHRHRIRVRIVGHTSMFPQDLQQTFVEIMESTSSYENYVLNLACGYDGRTELVDAMSKAVQDEAPMSHSELTKRLYVCQDMDLVIRTGKEQRMSGFFPWLTTYAEWFFLTIMWPEFTPDHLRDVLNQYYQRERRFGK